MKSTKVAIRYAKSLLELALEKGKLDQVANDMQYLRNTANENRDLTLLFNSPVVAPSKKLDIFKSLFDQFEDVSFAFIQLITKNGRENYLPEIATAFDGLVKEHKGIVPVELTTASKLDEATKEKILAQVKSSVEGTLDVTEIVDESIIGGFVVKMGDRRIDASIKSQFNKLKQSLTH